MKKLFLLGMLLMTFTFGKAQTELTLDNLSGHYFLVSILTTSEGYDCYNITTPPLSSSGEYDSPPLFTWIYPNPVNNSGATLIMGETVGIRLRHYPTSKLRATDICVEGVVPPTGSKTLCTITPPIQCITISWRFRDAAGSIVSPADATRLEITII